MKEKGLTLVEILIALTLTILMSGLLLAILVNSTNVFRNQSVKIEQGMDINDTLSKIRESVKGANAVIEKYQDGVTLYTSSDQTVVLKQSSVDSSGSIIPSTDDYVIFTLEEKKLWLKIFPNAQSVKKRHDELLATGVESIKFEYFDDNNLISLPKDAGKVKVTIKLLQKNGLDIQALTATSDASLRNN